MPDPSRTPLVIERSRFHLRAGLIVFLVLHAGGWLELLDVIHGPRAALNRPIGFISILIGLSGAILFALPILFRSPALRLDQGGATLYSLAGHPLPVPWAEIAGSTLTPTSTGDTLVIQVTHPNRLLSTLPIYERWIARSSERIFGSPIAFPVRSLDIDRRGLQALMDRIGEICILH